MNPLWSDLLLVNLRYGRDRARTLGELSEAMGAPRRALEQAVEQLRTQYGKPIISGPEGLWLSDDEAEIRACARSLSQRLVTQYRTVRALRATAERHRAARLVQMDLGWERDIELEVALAPIYPDSA